MTSLLSESESHRALVDRLEEFLAKLVVCLVQWQVQLVETEKKCCYLIFSY